MHFEASATPESTISEMFESGPKPAALASMADLDALSADLDRIDATLAELNRPATPAPSPGHQSSLS